MPTPAPVNGCKPADIGNIDLGTKYMSDIMRLGAGADWAQAILEADRAPVTNATVLNPTNGRQNTYGFLQLGIAARSPNWQAAEPAAKETLSAWVSKLNEDFAGTNEYKPGDLPKIAKNLVKAADQLVKNAECLVGKAEISPNDGKFFSTLAEGMKSAAANLGELHKAVCAGPNIEHVTLDIQARRH